MNEGSENKPKENQDGPAAASKEAADEAASQPEEAEQEAADKVAEEAGETPEDDMDAPAESPDEARELDPTVELEVEIAVLKDKLLRALAEAENVRRRAERDREDAFKYAIANFSREMLSVADNLGRALESVDRESLAENEALKSLVDGVEMTEKEMLNTFDRIGIEAIEAMGQKFDHNLHEAMFELEDKEKPAGTVVQQIQTGYMLNDRLLRPAKVGVSKGGPKPPPDEAPAEARKDDDSKGEQQARESAQVYEKQVDQQSESSGSKLDEEL
ncbi:MAG: nucleotide exchange factor GrpE [Rhodospirillales bacterium]